MSFDFFLIIFMIFGIFHDLSFSQYILDHIFGITNVLYNNQVQNVKNRVISLHIISVLNSQFLNALLYSQFQEKVDLIQTIFPFLNLCSFYNCNLKVTFLIVVTYNQNQNTELHILFSGSQLVEIKFV